MSDLIERLNDDVRQLTKMVEHAKLAGPETGVRVKDPSLLLADLSEAADEIERLQRHIDALQEKDASNCGCAIDRPDDVCLFHSKMKGDTRRQAFIEAAEIAEKQAPKAVRVFHEEANITPSALEAAFEILAPTLRAKAEETRT
jgi:hypothetical protein